MINFIWSKPGKKAKEIHINYSRRVCLKMTQQEKILERNVNRELTEMCHAYYETAPGEKEGSVPRERNSLDELPDTICNLSYMVPLS